MVGKDRDQKSSRREVAKRRCIVIVVILRECLVPGETHFARVEAREIVDEGERERGRQRDRKWIKGEGSERVKKTTRCPIQIEIPANGFSPLGRVFREFVRSSFSARPFCKFTAINSISAPPTRCGWSLIT